jgi:hypothetical protein
MTTEQLQETQPMEADVDLQQAATTDDDTRGSFLLALGYARYLQSQQPPPPPQASSPTGAGTGRPQ